MAQPPLAVPELLLLTISLSGGGTLLPVLLPIFGVLRAPFTWTVPAHLPVFGIGGDLFPVIVCAALSLALGFVAHGLAKLKLRWLEDLLAVEATPFTHIKGVVSPRRSRSTPVAEFRNWCRVLPRPRQWLNYKTGSIALVSHRRQHLASVFLPLMPRVEEYGPEDQRPDQRYWWLQLHRLIASKA